MSQAIQTFLGAKRSNLDLELPSSKHSSANEKKLIEKDEGSFQHNAGRLVLEKLTELKEIVDRDGGSLTLNKLQGHKQSPKQDLKNEVVASEREKRLIEGLKRLSRQKKAAHHEAVRKKRVHIVSLQAAFEKQKKQLRRHLQSKLNNNRQEQSEMEQVLDDMRRELEVMIKELNQSKQQREHSEQKSKRLQDGLKALQSPNTKNPDVLALQSLLQESEAQVDHLEATNQEKIDKLEQSKQDFAKESSRIHATHTHQINALVFEKEELRARLIQAAKSAAEHNSELEEALRRTVAERDAELAKTKLELEKSKRHYEQLQKLTKKQMQLELDTRLNELKSSLKLQHRKEVDTYQLGLSRELRNMSGQIVELETELQDLERQHLRDIKSIQQYKPKLATLEKELMNWKDKEAGLKSELMKSNQKVSILEEEALVLFSKNLELAQRLSGLDS
ncbi:hypothetical protein BD408DRAFT_479244 [Parasitella parasitica]|nr:hypothetical protein BD408DRAFT_479244 [Parasitella parasitica]